MSRKLPPYAYYERSRHGRLQIYYRRGKGARIRLPDDPKSDEFRAAYEAALMAVPAPRRGAKAAPPHSLQRLVEEHMASAKWAALSPATRRQRELIFLDAIRRSGNPGYLEITPKVIRKAMDARASTPAQANNFLKAFKSLFNWAVAMEIVGTNPCVGVERISYKSIGFKPWTEADVQLFCSCWPIGTRERLALELLLAVGLRRGDLHLAGKQHLRGDVFSMKTGKTGAEVTVRLSTSMLEIIRNTPTGDLHFLTTSHGRPFESKESLGNWFSKAARQAGIGKSAHGLRKLAATIAANEGGTAHELMAHFGWSNMKEAETYTKGADRKRLGLASSERVSERIANIIPRTSE